MPLYIYIRIVDLVNVIVDFLMYKELKKAI